MRRTHRMAMVTLTAVALAGAGCGSSDSDAAFTAKLNAICGPSTAAINNLDPQVPADFKSAEGVVAGTLSKLQALSPPANRAVAYHAFLSDFKQLDTLFLQDVSAVSQGNAAAAMSIDTRAQSLIAKTDAADKAAHIQCT